MCLDMVLRLSDRSLVCDCVSCRAMYVDLCLIFFLQAEDGIRDLVRSRGLGDVYKRQGLVLVLGLALRVRRRLLLSA